MTRFFVNALLVSDICAGPVVFDAADPGLLGYGGNAIVVGALFVAGVSAVAAALITRHFRKK